MTVMGQINARSRPAGRPYDEPSRQLRLEGAQASFEHEHDAVSVTNVSRTGMLLDTRVPLSVGDPLQILLPDEAPFMAIVVWASETVFACEFERSLTASMISKVKLARVPESPKGVPMTRTAPETPDSETWGTETLGERIRRLRLERGFGMTHFASRIGVSKPTLWKWEKSTVIPRTQMVQTIARALCVSEKELIFGNERQSIKTNEQRSSTVFDTRESAVAAKKEELAKLFGVCPSKVVVTIQV